MPQEYWDYCDSNDAKRNWFRIKFGKSQRGTTESLKKDAVEIKDNLKLVKEIKTIARGSKVAMKECMKELKEVLSKRNEKG